MYINKKHVVNGLRLQAYVASAVLTQIELDFTGVHLQCTKQRNKEINKDTQ